jgi:ATP/maltotriose-dependent transcriptional regulator MalT
VARPPALAKITVPRLSRILPRPRLFRSLDGALRGRIQWIVAPPGAGKTALATSWLEERGLSPLWVQLDEGDGDVATFFHYLSQAAALRVRGRRPLPGFTPEYLTAPGGFARRFFRALCASVSPPFALVLDDYHAIRADSPVHAALRDGLAELPEGAAAVVLSRGEPPAALARLRASGRLDVLRGEPLSLSEREAKAIAALWGYTGRDRATVLALHSRTQGWAAGLVLLLAGWRTAPREQRADDERALFDYFAEEVLAHSDTETRTVLLETAALPRVGGEQAVRLTGVARAGEILGDLARRGYFVERHGEPPVFQYHALFREFLLGRAERALPAERRARVQLAAAAELAAAGQVDDAFQLYARAGGWKEAGGIVCREAPGLLAQGRAETVIRWIAGMPEELREAEPWLLLWLGTARSPFDPRGARASLEKAFELFVGAGDAAGAHLAWSAVAEGLFFEMDDLAPLDRWLSVLGDLLRRFPRSPGLDVEARLVATAFGAFMNRQPWSPELRVWEERALSLALAPGEPRRRLPAGRELAVFYGWWSMDLSKGRVVVDTLRLLATGKGSDPASTIFWHIADADLNLHLARVEACLAAVERGLSVANESGLHLWDSFLLLIRCWAALMQGDLDAASRTLEAVRGGAEGAPKLVACGYHYAAAVVARLRGEVGLAREHGRISVELAVAGGMPLAEASCRLARALAAPPETARAELEEALALARRVGTRIVETASLLALALRDLREGDERGAVERVRAAFAVARDLRNRHAFWLSREELADCCALALEHGIEGEYVRDLVAAQRLAPGERAREQEAWPWSVRIEALGGFGVTRDGAPLPVGRKEQKKPMELLRLLVAQGPRGARQDLLAEALWPDAEGDAAHHSLGTTVYRLRKLLGSAEAIVQQEGRVALDAASVFVDAWALDRLLTRAEAAAAGRAGSADGAALRARVRELYCGPLFGTDGDDPALAPARDRLRGRVERWLHAP